MRQLLSAVSVLGIVFALIPVSADAQLFRRPFHHCCETCQLPHAECSCSQTQQVVQTQLQAQQVTTYRDVVETHVRNETVVQNVPVTTYKQVTVDEGNYQMVWVPKPVTKQVAQTVIQQQAQTRAVPYQVVRKVPTLTTQLVPVQTVQQVTTSVPMTTWAPAPVMYQAARSCNTCNNPFGTAMQPQYIPLQAATLPTVQYAPVAVAPATISIPTMPAISVPLPQTARGPSPANDSWQTIPSRSSSSSNRSYDSPSSVPVPMEEARHSGAAGRFVAAPSAATVWNSRR